jgi:hypothetical protein
VVANGLDGGDEHRGGLHQRHVRQSHIYFFLDTAAFGCFSTTLARCAVLVTAL